MSQQQHKWGYSGDLIGPNEWPKYFHTGQHQSPINILVNNCRHVAQSTCCHQNDKHVYERQNIHDHKLVNDHEARLHERLRNSLQIGSSHHRRAHLDSVGSEDHHRSPSTSSSGSHNSSFSSSPDIEKINNNNNKNKNNSSGNNSSDYDQDGFGDEDYEDDYERDYDEERDKSKGRYKQKSSSSNSATSSEATTIRFNDCKRKQQQTGTCCVTQVQNTRHCVSRKKIFLGYPRYLNTMQLCNTGHNWQVNLPSELAAHTRKCPI